METGKKVVTQPSEKKLSLTQRLILFVMPRAWAAAAEKETRTWIMTCPKCMSKQSLWDAGGIRWKAKGSKVIFLKCPACGESSFQNLVRKV